MGFVPSPRAARPELSLGASGLALVVALLAASSPAQAQGTEADGGPSGIGASATPPATDEMAVPALSLSEEALAAGAGDDDEEADDEDEILAPTERPRPSDEELEAEEEGERAAEEPDGEPTIIDDDMELPPDPPDLPEFRLRAGAGVALPTAGDFGLGFRITQDFEWQPRGGEPFFVGLGGAEILGAGVVGQAHVRLGLHAWFCEERPVRCQAAVAFVGGAAFGSNLVAPNIAGDTDLRFLFWERLELHVRGGFSFLANVPFIDITGGIGVAF